MIFSPAFVVTIIFCNIPTGGMQLPKYILEKVLPQHCQSQGKIQSGDLSTPNCTLGLHQKPQTFVEITCPEVDVFIVKGDYTIFYIACSSSFPLDFSFNGIRPTEAIDVSFKRQEKDGSDREKFLYLVDVQVRSNTALLKYYYPDSSISKSRKPGAAVYSRTGSYSFSGFHDRSNISTNFYIFFEEPLVEPNFITNRNIVLEIEDDIIRIPCRPTTFNASVNLLQNGQLVQNSLYSPQNGFSILHEASFLNLSTKFSCHLVNDNRTVTIDIPMTRVKNVSNTAYVHKDPTVNAVLESRGFGVWIYSLISCQVTDEKSDIKGSNSLAAIGHVNPSMFKLRRAFVFPAHRNRSYSLQFGKRDVDLRHHFVIQNELPQETLSVYCGSESEHSITSISRTVNGKVFPFNYDEDWSLIRREWIVEYRFFLLGFSHQNQILYENTEVQFTCAVSTFSIIPPMMWYVVYSNGTTKQEAYDHNWINGTSTFNKTLTLEVTQVICAASLWNVNDWRNASVNVTVQSCVPPDFGNQSSILKYPRGSKIFITCSASGDPQPEVYWERYGEAVTNKSLGFTLLEFRSANYNHSGVYTCIAVNCGDKESVKKNFTVEVSQEKLQSALSETMSGDRAMYKLIIQTIIQVVMWAALVVSAVLFILIIIAFLIYRNRRKKKGGLTISEISDFIGGTITFSNPGDANTGALEMIDMPHSIPYDRTMEISRKRFQIDKTCILGGGEYGKVYKGLLDGKPVAVKTVKDEEDSSYLKSLLSELKVMNYVGSHPNLIKLLGAYTKHLETGKAYLFVDYCSFGDINSYLKKGRSQIVNSNDGDLDLTNVCDSFKVKDMYSWSAQIASGMAYLSEKKVIHGDLATRNILLTENHKVKITDFGLSRRLYDYAEYIRKEEERVPWRWLSLESMKNAIFSCQSDIWSYGVTIWEIFSLARTPYPSSYWGVAFITQIENGMRLPRPDYASQQLYDMIMMECWNSDPVRRPSFDIIEDLLKTLCSSVEGSSSYVSTNTLLVNSQTPQTSTGCTPDSSDFE